MMLRYAHLPLLAGDLPTADKHLCAAAIHGLVLAGANTYAPAYAGLTRISCTGRYRLDPTDCDRTRLAAR